MIIPSRTLDRDTGLCNLLAIDKTGELRSFTSKISDDIFGMPQTLSQNVKHVVSAEPIACTFKVLPPISLQLVSQSSLEPLWDHLVKSYHYLGYRKLLGHRLKYIAFIENRPIAALSWSAPALKLRTRDAFIGWSIEQRKLYLRHVVNNSRFLILPWVNVPHLASHILSRNIRILRKDWHQNFNNDLWLLETFVDPQRFKGTSYKAANWQFLGITHGSGKQGDGYVFHGNKKEIYAYVLDPKFRTYIGCKQESPNPPHRPPPTTKEVEELRMILRHADWNPNAIPCMDLTEDDVKNLADELVCFHEQFHSCFGRTEQQRLGLAYFSGLLSNSKGKSAEPIALEFLDGQSVRSLQRFMKTYIWDQQAMENIHQTILSEAISCPGGMINVDGSDFLKKGKESVGVARQYCGEAGKVDNCQSGVFAGYSSKKGYGLLTSKLYMPEIWFSEEYAERCADNHVPSDLTFKTKLQIALELIENVAKSNLFQAEWVGCDATFGSDINFLNSLPEGLCYFAHIRSDTKVFLEKPKVGLPPYKGRGPRPKKETILPGQVEAGKVSNIVKFHDIKWTPVVLDEGAKGPIIAHVAAFRVYPSRNGMPEDSPVWLFLRRSSDGQIKFALSNAPEDIPFSKLCKASLMRWPIEQCFEEGKSHLGMGEYEHRSWPAWHRHMTYVFLALNFLFQLRLKFKKNSGADITSGTKVSNGCLTTGFTQHKASFGNNSLPYSKKLCGLQIS